MINKDKKSKNVGAGCHPCQEGNKGITLIALIITIIIMLILVAVTIDIAVDGKLFDKAQEAVDRTNDKVGNAQNRIDGLMGYLDGNGGSQTGGNNTGNNGNTTGGNTTGGENTDGDDTDDTEIIPPFTIVDENTEYTDANEDVAIIPKGFGVSTESTERTIEDGLVIIDEDDNEFVWIPVANINSMVMCQEHETSATLTYNITSAKLECNLCTQNGITETDFCGKLYADSNWDFDASLTGQTYDATSGFREPSVLTSNETGDGYILADGFTTTNTTAGAYLLNTILGITNTANNLTENATWYTDQNIANNVRDNFGELMQSRFNEMATSVAKNKGFYVGRYESSLSGEKAQSKYNQPVMASVNWYQMYKYEYNYSPKTDASKGVTSEMIWGCQGDQMMLFLNSKTRTDGAGNSFSITSGNSARHDSSGIKNTAQNTADKIANLYDLEGNYSEWSQEAYHVGMRSARGGEYDDGSYYAVSRRYTSNPCFGGPNCSSRVTLTIK